MKTEEVVKMLNNLAQLDIDAISAYKQALKNIDDNEIAAALKTFQQDHQRHVEDLTVTVKKLGGNPPNFTPDIKGFLLQGFTAIRSLTGTVGALKAMQSNEKLTTKTYEEAMQENYPSDIKSLIEKNFNDEKRHYRYIQETLKKMST